MPSARYWIDRLGLTAHPEGGYYREIYRASESIAAEHLPERFGGERFFSTSIYFLLQGEQVSRLHRIKSDEIWHFYAGSSLTVYTLDEVGGLSTLKLGRDLEQGEAFQVVVPAGVWFGAEVNDRLSYALVGCTVAPGFHFDDLELAERAALLEQYPAHREIIERLTRQA